MPTLPRSPVANAASMGDLAAIARRRLPRFVYNYLEGGAGDDAGVRRNEAAFRELVFDVRRCAGPPVAGGVQRLGREWSQPFGVAPLGMANLCWPGTDLMLARLAQRENIPYVLSTAGTTSIERIAEAAPDVTWFQLYLSRDDAITDDMVRRAELAGIRTLVLTVDVPIASRRNRAIRDGFSLPFRYSGRTLWDLATHPAWSLATLRAGTPTLETYATYAKSENLQVVGRFIAELNRNFFDWDDVRRLRQRWTGTLIVKGILHPDDARTAIALGADAIWVSNHGGRQLEGAPASLHCLGDVKWAAAHAAGRHVPVLFDGGVRGGEDVVKAMALGADMVFTGRCFAFGAGAGGVAGADRAYHILSEELRNTLAQIGRPSLGAIDRSVLMETRAPARSGG